MEVIIFLSQYIMGMAGGMFLTGIVLEGTDKIDKDTHIKINVCGLIFIAVSFLFILRSQV